MSSLSNSLTRSLRTKLLVFFVSAAVLPLALAITLAVFAFNLFGDSVRDTLDPKLRSR